MVADRIISRLFDHRQFTAGQIDYFIKGIDSVSEEGVNLDKILKLNEKVCLVMDINDEETNKFRDDWAENVSQGVTSLIGIGNRLLDIETDSRNKETRAMSSIREEREKQRQNKTKSINIKLNQIEESLLAEELELERKYLKLEESLRRK